MSYNSRQWTSSLRDTPPIDPANRASQFSLRDSKLNTSQESIVSVPAVTSLAPGATSLVAAQRASSSVPRAASPVQLALPSLPRYQSTVVGSQPPTPENRRAESRLSSTYYTAAWGSPYAASSPRQVPSSIRSRQGIVDFGLPETSPNNSMHTGQPEPSRGNQNIESQDSGVSPAELSQRFYGALGKRLEKDRLVRQGGKSIKDFTQDWINQYISGQARSERTNWLSDDSNDDVASFLTARNHLSESEGWLGLDDEPLGGEDPLKTPTAANFFSRKLKGQADRLEVPKSRSRHLKTFSTDTLKQSDFWDFGYDQDAGPAVMPDTQLPEATQAESAPGRESNMSVSPAEKPLPPPPTVDEESPAPPLPPSPKRTPVPRMNRPKKKVLWKGRQCVIALPLSDTRGTAQGSGALLKPEDVERRLKEWENAGYDVNTFGFESAQSRPAFPDATECQKEMQEKKFAVSFPNKDEWDAYVNLLKEEKLRALGVSLGDDVVSAPMSQSSSQFIENAISPPLPTLSAASNHMNMAGNPLATVMGQSMNPNASLLSLTSPSSPFGFTTGSPFSNPPVSFPSEPAFPFIPFQTPATTTQGTLTPQNLYGLRTGVVSPVGLTSMPNIAPLLQPVSPLTPDESKQYQTGFGVHPQFNNAFSEQPQTSQFADGSNIISPPLDDLAPDVEAESDTIQSSGPEIAHPTPRGHRHNLSETLQRGVERGDFQLEHAMGRQFDQDQGNTNDLMKSRWAMPEESSRQQFSMQPQPSQQHQLLQQQLYGQELPDENQLEGSEIDTNPSLLGTPTNESMPHQSFKPVSQPDPSANSFVPGHQARSSLTNFNVAAKAFDPTASFQPGNFSFTANSFQPKTHRPGSIFSSGISQHSANSSNFNANAPSFEAHSNQNSVSNFRFSAASFNVDAPVFNPGQSVHSDVKRDTVTDNKPKIFSSFTPVVVPSKQSKAIPIIRPEEIKTEERTDGDIIEDETGRMGSQGREKRMRRMQGDGDQEVSLPTLADIQAESKDVPVSIDGQTTTSEFDAKPKIEDINDELEAETDRSATWKPFEFENEADAASFNAALPVSSLPFMDEDVVSTKRSPLSLKLEDSVDDAPVKTGLKPTAKPFEFKPTAAPFSVGTSGNDTVPEPKKMAGLESSIYAVKQSPDISPDLPAVGRDSPVSELPQDTSIKSESVRDVSGGESPDEQEIDAVMRQLNEDDMELGVERVEMDSSPIRPAAMSDKYVHEQQYGTSELATSTLSRSDAPSPSVQERSQTRDHLFRLNTGTIEPPYTMFTPQQSSKLRTQSPVRRLNNPDIEYISDWDDAITSGQEEELRQRAQFFGNHVDGLIGSVLDDRLLPLERTLETIETSISLLASQRASARRSTSIDVDNSDADDEDEDERHRSRSPMKNRLLEKIRQVVSESMQAHKSVSEPPAVDLSDVLGSLAELKILTSQHATREPPPVDFSEVHASISVLKNLISTKPEPKDPRELKDDIVESIISHPKLSEMMRLSSDEKNTEKMNMQIEGLQSMLRLADERAEEEYNNRRRIHDSLTESQRLLKAAEEDAMRYKDAATAAESALEAFKAEKVPEIERLEKQSGLLNDNQESLQLTLSELSQKNIALQGNLDEYRETGDHLRSELDGVRSENKELRHTIDLLKTQLEDNLESRKSLRGKIEKLQDDMVIATRDIAKEQSAWKLKEEDQNIQYNLLKAQYEDELRRRQKLELHVGDLEEKEMEATKLRFILGQSQEENAKLEELLMMLRQENHDLQSKAARFEREFNEARESSRAEIQRVRTSMESDLDHANHQVNFVRAELENQINNLENQLENTKMDSDTAKARFELLLEEARDAKLAALREAADAKEIALQEQRIISERTLNDLRERHARALHNGSEDRAREESHYMELLALRDEKIEHLHEKIGHLHDKIEHMEEKLEIAKTAARTAAQAAQNAKAAQIASPPAQIASPSMTFAKGTGVPDKISPQALRESIMVLQDQLQQREGRIEELEHELSLIDKDAPAKVKEKETEITWLRELLHVRLDDLRDIIHVLSQPSFNQSAVRDAAIRLKANLQMQQQEKERAMTGGNSQAFPSLATISSLAASPRALPLAAAAAWGNWRKGRENSTTSSIMDNMPSGTEQTPSKSSGSSFLTGLLTPPQSNIRAYGQSGHPSPRGYSDTRPLRSSGPDRRRRPSNLQPSQNQPRSLESPRTPPLLHKASYDHDAEAASYDDAYVDDNDSIISSILAQGSTIPNNDGPFGPAI